MTKLPDTFSVSFFLAKDSTINTRYSVVNFISVDLSTLLTNTDCTAPIRLGVTPSVIGSYISDLREMLCLNEEDCAD
jgi:hypothetical protein